MDFNFIIIIDILVTVLVLYKFFSLIKETRAIQLLNGILVLSLIGIASKFLGLKIFNFLLEQIKFLVLIAIPVVFQPELRSALERIGRGKFISYLKRQNNFQTNIDKLVAAVMTLSKEEIGALIVIKRGTGLQDIIDTGVKIDAILSMELLINIFTPNSPLHDGAIIIDDNRIVAANCLLPLTQNNRLKQSLGTRHRAALGMSQESDAVIIVVSEETGMVSTMIDGKIKYGLDEFTLKEKLFGKFEDMSKD